MFSNEILALKPPARGPPRAHSSADSGAGGRSGAPERRSSRGRAPALLLFIFRSFYRYFVKIAALAAPAGAEFERRPCRRL